MVLQGVFLATVASGFCFRDLNLPPDIFMATSILSARHKIRLDQKSTEAMCIYRDLHMYMKQLG